MFILFPRTSHKMIAYFEEEAVSSYNDYLRLVENGFVENVPAPQISIDYYNMSKDAKLSDLIINVRNDEMHHSETNHNFADINESIIFNRDSNKKSIIQSISSKKFSDEVINFEISRRN